MESGMDDVLEGAVCGVDGCNPAALDHVDPASGAKATLAIEVISDAICPWCWVAKRRLESALAALAPDITATVTWRPFELNPEMPKAGVDRRAYRSAKFGSWQRSQALDAQVAATMLIRIAVPDCASRLAALGKPRSMRALLVNTTTSATMAAARAI